MLIAFSGLPASGKSTIARQLALALGATWLRIDSIERAITASGVVSGSLNDAGYRVAYAAAEDNLRLGNAVIGDSVNPWMLTRDAWREVGRRAAAEVVEVEVVCSDEGEHRRRAESRPNDVPGLEYPDWALIAARNYHLWDRERLVVDSSAHSVEECVALIRRALPPRGSY